MFSVWLVNKRLNKQPSYRWFQKSWWSCDVSVMILQETKSPWSCLRLKKYVPFSELCYTFFWETFHTLLRTKGHSCTTEGNWFNKLTPYLHKMQPETSWAYFTNGVWYEIPNHVKRRFSPVVMIQSALSDVHIASTVPTSWARCDLIRPCDRTGPSFAKCNNKVPHSELINYLLYLPHCLTSLYLTQWDRITHFLRQWMWSTLLHKIRQISSKPLPEPMLTCYQSDHEEQISVNSLWLYWTQTH